MPCEPYKDALIEAANSGSELQAELRTHLSTCAACSAAFAEEQALFSSIDASLHAATNVEAPPSLMPNVRARLAEEAIPNRGWSANRLALAAAVAMLVAFIAARSLRRAPIDPKSTPAVTNVASQMPEFPPQAKDSKSAPPLTNNSIPSVSVEKIRNSAPRELQVVHNNTPEVLVPQDQEALLATYAEQWARRKRAPLLVANFDATTLSPLQIRPIQITQLDVKPMTEEHAQ